MVKTLQNLNEPSEKDKAFYTCCAPIFWGDGKSEPRSGTITFFKHPKSKKTIAITNYHVYQGLLKNTGKVKVLSLDFNLEERLISFHPQYDLATFDISDKELTSINKSYAIQADPYVKVKEVTDGLDIVGFPGYLRDIKPSGIYFHSMEASGVSIKRQTNELLVVDVSIQNDATIVEFKKKYSPEFYYSGFSGAPLCAIEARTNKPILIGIIFGGFDKGTSLEENVLLARPINCIDENGKIITP